MKPRNISIKAKNSIRASECFHQRVYYETPDYFFLLLQVKDIFSFEHKKCKNWRFLPFFCRATIFEEHRQSSKNSWSLNRRSFLWTRVMTTPKPLKLSLCKQSLKRVYFREPIIFFWIMQIFFSHFLTYGSTIVIVLPFYSLSPFLVQSPSRALITRAFFTAFCW